MTFLEELERLEDAANQFFAVALPDLLEQRDSGADLDMVYDRLVRLADMMLNGMTFVWHESARR